MRSYETEYRAGFWKALQEAFFDEFDEFDDVALEVTWHPFTELIRIFGRAEGGAIRAAPLARGQMVPGMRTAAKDALVNARIIELESKLISKRRTERALGLTHDELRTRWRVLPGWRDRIEDQLTASIVGDLLSRLPDGD